MQRSRNEHTVASVCQVHGRGYWTGQHVRVTIRPAAAGSGVTFVRTDLPGSPSCPALAEYRDDAALRTNLQLGEARFEMIEHLMAAIVAFEIDNCIVEIDGMEFPAFDGSSQAFVEALSGAGLIIQARARRQIVIDQRYRVGTMEGWVEAVPAKLDESYFEYQLSFDDETPIDPQAYSVELTPGRFVREVASARTFVTQSQASQIRASGIAQHVTNQDLVVLGSDGPIENTFRYRNECARHKTLDLIGDLGLAGVGIVGRVTSFRGGHRLNGKMAALLAELAKAQAMQVPTKLNPFTHRRKAA